MEVDQSGPFGYPPYASYHPDPRAQALAQQQQQRSLQSNQIMKNCAINIHFCTFVAKTHKIILCFDLSQKFFL